MTSYHGNYPCPSDSIQMLDPFVSIIDDFNALQEEEKKRIYGHHLNNLIVS